jgi:hypothetical protein
MAKKKIIKIVSGGKKVLDQQGVDLKQVPENAVPVMARNELIAGTYCNIALVHHTEREFVFDFIFGIANQSSLVSRVITSPQHVKMIHKVLGENIKKYEDKFGEIKVSSKLTIPNKH